MGIVTVATTIQAPPEKVWDLLCDVERFREWNQFVGEVTSFSHSPLRALSVYSAGGGRRETKWRVTAFQPPQRQVHVARVPVLGEVTLEALVEWRGDYTVLVHIVSFRAMPGFLRPLGLLLEKLTVEKRVRQAIAGSQAAAKKLLEPVAVGA
jgi:uncharacterized membrane protein